MHAPNMPGVGYPNVGHSPVPTCPMFVQAPSHPPSRPRSVSAPWKRRGIAFSLASGEVRAGAMAGRSPSLRLNAFADGARVHPRPPLPTLGERPDVCLRGRDVVEVTISRRSAWILGVGTSVALAACIGWIVGADFRSRVVVDAMHGSVSSPPDPIQEPSGEWPAAKPVGFPSLPTGILGSAASGGAGVVSSTPEPSQLHSGPRRVSVSVEAASLPIGDGFVVGLDGCTSELVLDWVGLRSRATGDWTFGA